MKQGVKEVVIGGSWIFLANLTSSTTSLLFWFLLSNLVGVKSIGIASMVVSSSSIAVIIISAGLNIAIIREIAARDKRALQASLALAVVVGVIAAIISSILVNALGQFSFLKIMTATIAFLIVIANTLRSILLGLEKFKGYFLMTLTASITKLFIGVAFAILGLKSLAPLMGYLAYPLTMLIFAVIVFTSSLNMKSLILIQSINKYLREIITLALSNYPYVFSDQLLSALSVYLFAYITRESILTGTLYVILMISAATAMIPSSILSATLPIAVRRNANPFFDSFRVGLSLTIPITVAIACAPTFILNLINPGLVEEADALRILMLSMVPAITLMTYIIKLNKETRRKLIVLMGAIKLIVLLASLPPLINFWHVKGVVLAFLLATTFPLALVWKDEPLLIRLALKLWGIQSAMIMLSYLVPVEEFYKLILFPLWTLIVIHIINIFTLNELSMLFKVIFIAVFHGNEKSK